MLMSYDNVLVLSAVVVTSLHPRSEVEVDTSPREDPAAVGV